MTKSRTYIAVAVFAIGLTTTSISLLNAKSKKDPAIKEACDESFHICVDRCNKYSGDERGACVHECELEHGACLKNKVIAKPLPSPAGSISPRPTVVPRTQELKANNSPSPMPRPKKTPKKQKP
jgi:hypothetical protein